MRKRIKYVNKLEMDNLLALVKEMCVNVYFREKRSDEPFAQNAWVENNLTQVKLSFCKGLKPCTYIFSLNNEENKHTINGFEAYRTTNRYAHIQTIEKDAPKSEAPVFNDYDGKYHIGSAKPLLWKNPAYAGKRVKAYGYDLNSAYAKMLLEPIPDISTLKKIDVIGENQIGFIERPDGSLDISFTKGKVCDYVCDLMPSPFGRFVKVWYDRKKKAKDPIEKQKAKDMLNFPIGYTQNTNPFFRACIVGRCNLFMKSLMNKNTIYSNTDSIISLVRRPDLEQNLGIEVGQWKLEHINEDFAWDAEKLNYQWSLDIPAYRGIPKQWFKTFEIKNGKPFDILTDNVPASGNIYKFNAETLTIETINYEGV